MLHIGRYATVGIALIAALVLSACAVRARIGDTTMALDITPVACPPEDQQQPHGTTEIEIKGKKIKVTAIGEGIYKDADGNCYRIRGGIRHEFDAPDGLEISKPDRDLFGKAHFEKLLPPDPETEARTAILGPGSGLEFTSLSFDTNDALAYILANGSAGSLGTGELTVPAWMVPSELEFAPSVLVTDIPASGTTLPLMKLEGPAEALFDILFTIGVTEMTLTGNTVWVDNEEVGQGEEIKVEFLPDGYRLEGVMAEDLIVPYAPPLG